MQQRKYSVDLDWHVYEICVCYCMTEVELIAVVSRKLLLRCRFEGIIVLEWFSKGWFMFLIRRRLFFLCVRKHQMIVRLVLITIRPVPWITLYDPVLRYLLRIFATVTIRRSFWYRKQKRRILFTMHAIQNEGITMKNL